MPETRVITVMSPDYVANPPAGTIFTEGTDFFNATLAEPNPRKVSGRAVYNGTFIFGATDKGAEFTITLNAIYKTFAQKRAFETAVRTWQTLAGTTSIKETFSGGSTTNRQWKGKIVALPINEIPGGEGPPGGGKMSLTLVLTADPTDG